MIVLVTGAADGIGRCIIELFSTHGHSCIGLIRRSKESLVANDNIRYYECDISCRRTVDDVFADVTKHHATIDVLVNNAGIICNRSFVDCTHEEQKEVFDTNVHGTMNVTRNALTMLSCSNFVNILSSCLDGGRAGLSCYAASKAAVKAYFDCLVLENGELSVLNVLPKRTYTKMRSIHFPSKDYSDCLDPVTVSKMIYERCLRCVSKPGARDFAIR